MKKSRLSWEEIAEFFETLPETEDALAREMIYRISDMKPLWTGSVVADVPEPMRFSRIMEHVEGISQKSLTKTLRGLERDGSSRKIFAEVPPGLNTRSQPSGPRCSTASHPSDSGRQRASSSFRPAELRSTTGRPARKE